MSLQTQNVAALKTATTYKPYAKDRLGFGLGLVPGLFSVRALQTLYSQSQVSWLTASVVLNVC